MDLMTVNLVTMFGIILMLIIAGLPLIWNIAILCLTVGFCCGLSINHK